MDSQKEQLKAGLNDAAETCIANDTGAWWSDNVTSQRVFDAANSFCSPTDTSAATPDEAALFLLFVAEAIE